MAVWLVARWNKNVAGVFGLPFFISKESSRFTAIPFEIKVFREDAQLAFFIYGGKYEIR